MSDRRDNRAVTYLTEAESVKLDEWAEETGHSRSNLLREAVREYLDHDRNDRIERELAEVRDELAEHRSLVEEQQHTHTNSALSTGGSDAVEKARRIHRRIADNHDEVVKDDVVTRAIEDIAGADPRTVEKYKGILKRRLLLFEYPSPESPIWTSERSEWVTWCEEYINRSPTATPSDVVEGYDLTTDEYDSLVESELEGVAADV
jgi:predicted transcriptional regulator